MTRALLRGVSSTLLLAGGFASYLVAVYAWERPADADAAQKLHVALEVYGRLLLVRGLLPQLWLTLPLVALLEHTLPLRARTGARLAAWVALAAGLAGLLAAAVLLPANLPGAPRVVFAGPVNFALTWLEMSAGVVAAVLLPRLVWSALR